MSTPCTNGPRVSVVVLTYFEMLAKVIFEYVTPLIVPVSPSIALMRIPFHSPLASKMWQLPEGDRTLTIHGVFHFVVVESNAFHGIVSPSTNRANRKPMASGADRILNSDILFTSLVANLVRPCSAGGQNSLCQS